jgi:hypothetical protein
VMYFRPYPRGIEWRLDQRLPVLTK